MNRENLEKLVEIYVDLPEEGSPTLCRTNAEVLEDGLYKILPTDNYDPEDEIWEFVPGTIVRAEIIDNDGENILVAVEKVS